MINVLWWNNSCKTKITNFASFIDCKKNVRKLQITMNNVLFVKVLQTLKNLFDVRIKLFLFQERFFESKRLLCWLIKFYTVSTRNRIYGIWEKIGDLLLKLIWSLLWIECWMILMFRRCIRGVLMGTEVTVISHHKGLLLFKRLLFVNKFADATKIISAQFHNNVRVFGTTQYLKTFYKVLMLYFHQYVNLL